jgi:hypothetical protein
LGNNLLQNKNYYFYPIKIENVQDTAAFEDTLKNQTTYVIDEVFVQDRLLWKIAQGKDGSPLN